MPVSKEVLDYNAARKQKARESGICTYCQHRPATTGKRGGRELCEVCLERKRLENVSRREEIVARNTERRAEYAAERKCVYCGEPAITGPRGGSRMCQACKDHWLTTRSDRKRRFKAIAIYGKRCKDCGTDDYRVLEFHHNNGDGAKHRKDGGGTRTMRRIATSGEPDPTIDMICANCHRIRHWDTRWKPDWHQAEITDEQSRSDPT